MRNFIKYLFSIVLLAGVISCEKEEIRAVLNSEATPGLKLSAANIALSKDAADENALTISWSKPDFGYNAAAQYQILIAKRGTNFNDAQVFSTGQETSKSWTHKQLNNLLQSMGVKGNETADLEIAVESILSQDLVQRSEILPFSAVAYLDKLDLSTSWGLVGSATVNGWNGPDMPFYKTASAGVFVAYAKLNSGEIKIRENNDWAVNYGDNGADGTVELNGANIAVDAGTYRILFDINKLTVKVEKYSWGLVGSATPNSWNGPDIDFFYDPATDQWRALATLVDGEIKIRKNNDWGLNYGDTGNDGTLEANGDNIKVSAGNYLVTFNANELTISIEKTNFPGVVGSATPNSWNGPDIVMLPDFSTDGLWVAKFAKLSDGEIKFRMNNDWGTNYGDTGKDGTLDLNGDNIAVSAGTYNIEINLETLTYKLTKL